MNSTRKVGIGTAILLGVLSLFTVSCGTAAPAANEFTVRATTIQRADVDLGQPGRSQGDETIFSTTITRDGRSFGLGNAVCTTTRFVSDQDFTIQCHITFRFPEGHIAANAILDGAEQGRYFESITGGNGIYKNARGEVLVVLIEPTVVDLTFRLA